MNPETLPLRDIHLPGDVSWWPLAVGWWVLIFLACAVTVWFVRSYWRLEARRQRAALKALGQLQNEWQQQQDSSGFLKGLSALLRRYAIAIAGRQQAAGLAGEEWRKFLNEKFDDLPFRGELGDRLLAAPYQHKMQPLTAADAEALIALCDRWIRSRR